MDMNKSIKIFDPSLILEAAAHNERGIELGMTQKWLNIIPDIVEVGAVTPYYFPGYTHDIIDPYDPYDKCIKIDAEQYSFIGRNVLCISTIEHMGTGDYGNKDIDTDKPIRFLQKILAEAKTFLITFPIGSNVHLDMYVKNSLHIPFTIYKRIGYNPPLWLQTMDLSAFHTAYNSPFPNGNAICVIASPITYFRESYENC